MLRRYAISIHNQCWLNACHQHPECWLVSVIPKQFHKNWLFLKWMQLGPELWFNIDMLSYQYRKSQLKVGGFSPSQVETCSVSKTLTLSQEYPFMCRKRMLLPSLTFLKLTFLQKYRKSHCGDNTDIRSSYLPNGNSYSGKISSLYWISPLNLFYLKQKRPSHLRVTIASMLPVDASFTVLYYACIPESPP